MLGESIDGEILKVSTKYIKNIDTNCVGARTANLQGTQTQEAPQDFEACPVTGKLGLQRET